MPDKYNEIESIAKYNLDNGTNFYTIDQVNEHIKKLQRLKQLQQEAKTSPTDIGEDVHAAYVSAGKKPETAEDVNRIEQFENNAKTVNAIGLAAAAALPEMFTYGALPGVASYLTGTAAGIGGGYLGQKAGKYIDNKLGTSVFAPGLEFVGGLAGYGAGSGLLTKTTPYQLLKLKRELLQTFGSSSNIIEASKNPVKWRYRSPFNKNGAEYGDNTIYSRLYAKPHTVAHEYGHHISYNYPGLKKDQILGAYTPSYEYSADIDPQVNYAENFADWFKTATGRSYKGNDPNLVARQKAINNGETKFFSLVKPDGKLGESKLSIAERAGIPKGERKYLTSWEGWSQGGPISDKHLIEYALIDNDLWRSKFKPWSGTDIRSHIQLHSKDAQKLNPKILYTGIEEEINPNYNGVLWTTRDGLTARAYTTSDDGVMQIVVPKEAKVNTYDAKGNGWFEIDGKKLWDKGYRTNDFVNESFNNGYDIAEIKNVIDIGPNPVSYRSKYNYFDNRLDFSDRAPIQTDVVIKSGYPRKSIVGNNGDFDLTNTNLFKKQGGTLNAQGGSKLLNKWQQLYDSKFGKTIRDAVRGTDSDLSNEEYLQKHGYYKPVGGLGAPTMVLAPEWEGLEFPEITAMHYGLKGASKGTSAVETSRFTTVPQKMVGKTLTNWEKFLQKPIEEQNSIIRMWNGERYSNFPQLHGSKDIYKFKNWLNKQ